jgi:CRISPR-associated protein Csh1
VIEAVRRIGDYVLQKNGSCEDSLATFMENPNSNGKYKVVLIVVLRETNGDYSFSRVVRDEFIQQNLYLYKKGAPNGTDATPTSMVAGDIKRTFDRFMEWFENYDDYKISDDEQDIIRKMSIALTDQGKEFSRILAIITLRESQRQMPS